MKKTYLLLTGLILLSVASFAQGTIDLTVKWNATASKYEVYAKPTFTSSAFTWERLKYQLLYLRQHQMQH